MYVNTQYSIIFIINLTYSLSAFLEMSDEGVNLTSGEHGQHQLHKKARLEEDEPQQLLSSVRTQNELSQKFRYTNNVLNSV